MGKGYIYNTGAVSNTFEDIPDIRAIFGVVSTRYLLAVDDSKCKWKYGELYSLITLYQNRFDAGFVNFPRMDNTCGTAFGESHAGFTFAAVSSWHLLNRVSRDDVKPFPLQNILISNLIDLQNACYSSWAYAPIKMLREFDSTATKDVDP